MDTTITAAELSKSLFAILNRVRYRGERFMVARNGEPIAVLGPTAQPTHIALRELAARMGDLPLPDDGFADDIEAMRQALGIEEPPTWSS